MKSDVEGLRFHLLNHNVDLVAGSLHRLQCLVLYTVLQVRYKTQAHWLSPLTIESHSCLCNKCHAKTIWKRSTNSFVTTLSDIRVFWDNLYIYLYDTSAISSILTAMWRDWLKLVENFWADSNVTGAAAEVVRGVSKRPGCCAYSPISVWENQSFRFVWVYACSV